MSLLLKNATVVRLHPPEVRASTDVLVDGATIAAVGAPGGRGAGTRVPDAKPGGILDLDGKILMPGLVCGHTHVYSALARGLTARVAPSSDFVQTLQHLWWRLDRAIDREILEASALAAALEAVRRGCTTIVDHHASPSFIEGSLDVIAGALERVGLRGVLCYETTDRNGTEGARRGIEENRRFAAKVEAGRRSRAAGQTPGDIAPPLVEAMIGGHAPFTLGDGTLDGLARVVEETGRGFHVHVSEDAYDAAHSHHAHRRDPLARLAARGLLSDRAIVGHGVHLTPADRELLAGAGAFLAHNARSNMNNRVGYTHALPSFPRVVLGTDGIGADMLEEFRAAFFKHRDAGGPLWPPDFARFLQAGNDLASRCFGGAFGSVEPGAVADLAVLDYRPPTPLSAENVAGHLAFGVSSADVETVIVNGRVVMEGRRFSWDTEAALARAREAARKLWRNMDALEE